GRSRARSDLQPRELLSGAAGPFRAAPPHGVPHRRHGHRSGRSLARTAVTSLLLRNVRIVHVRSPAPATAVDLRIDDGRVRDVAAGLTPEPGERVVDADGRWAIPGLWDQHVHLTQWAQTRIRLDLSGTDDPSEVTARVARHLARDTGSGWVFGFG